MDVCACYHPVPILCDSLPLAFARSTPGDWETQVQLMWEMRTRSTSREVARRQGNQPIKGVSSKFPLWAAGTKSKLGTLGASTEHGPHITIPIRARVAKVLILTPPSEMGWREEPGA